MKLRKFIRGEKYFFQMLNEEGSIILESQAYQSKDARNNDIDSVKNNISNSERYEIIEKGDKSYFILKANNGQEVGRSLEFKDGDELQSTMDYALKSRKAKKKPEIPPSVKVEPNIIQAPVSGPAQDDGGEAYSTDGKDDDYKPLKFYESNGRNVANGFDAFHAEREFYFSYSLDGLIYMISEGYKAEKSRDNGIKSVERNMDNPDRYQHQQHPNGKFFFNLRAGNNQEIATSRWMESENELNHIIDRLTSISAPSTSHDSEVDSLQDRAEPLAAVSTQVPTEEVKDKKRKKRKKPAKPKVEKVYLADGTYHSTDITYQLFRSSNNKHYYTFKNAQGKTVLMNSNVRGFDTEEEAKRSLELVIENGPDRSKYEEKTTKNDKFYFYLKGGDDSNIAKSFFFNTEGEMQAAISSLLVRSTTVSPDIGLSSSEAIKVKTSDQEVGGKVLLAAKAKGKAVESKASTKSDEDEATQGVKEVKSSKKMEKEKTSTEADKSSPISQEEKQIDEIRSESSGESASIAMSTKGGAEFISSSGEKLDQDSNPTIGSKGPTGGGFKWWWLMLILLLVVLIWFFI